MNLIRRIPVLASLGLSLFPCHFLYAQIDTGAILGTVALVDGSPVNNAQVTIRRIDTNEAVELLSNQTGYFRRDGLRVGRYQIVVRLEGFRTEVLRDLVLLVGQSLRADLQLQKGTATDEAVNQAEAVLLGEGRTDVGQVIDQEKLDTLPVNTRTSPNWLGWQPAQLPLRRTGAMSKSWE